jgi:hypothetical protein
VDFCVRQNAPRILHSVFNTNKRHATLRNSSSHSDNMRKVYQESFDGSPDSLRMALLNPLVVNGTLSQWYGVGGSSILGYSNIPTVGYAFRHLYFPNFRELTRMCLTALSLSQIISVSSKIHINKCIYLRVSF